MKAPFIASVQLMSSAEVLPLIDLDQRREIELIDAHPVYRVYRIGHEGESLPARFLHLGQAVMKWASSAVQQLHDKLQLGTGFYHLHNCDNATAGRETVGRVVGKAIRDKSVLAVAYIYPKYRDMKLDAASIETDVEVREIENRSGVAKVIDFLINQVTGIALGDADKFQPAHPRAGLLAQVAMFAEKGDKGMITINDVRDFLSDPQNKGVSPADLFPVEIILSDPEVKSANKNEYFARKRIEDEFKAKIAERDEKIKAQDAELGTVKAQMVEMGGKLIKGELPAMADSIIAEKKLSERAAKYVKKQIDKFTPPTDAEKLKEMFTKFVADKVVELEDILENVIGEAKQEEKKADEKSPKDTAPTSPDELTPAGLITE